MPYIYPAYSAPVPAIYQKDERANSWPAHLPSFGGAGTGGLENVSFYIDRQGYPTFTIDIVDLPDPVIGTSYTNLMAEIKNGFGRTFSHLPAVFGVSRQTLYNWSGGEQPKELHQAKLVQLAEAARVFTITGFKPSALNLQRTVAKGKSFIALLSEGESGRETAQKLIRIVNRGTADRNKLNALLENRKAPPLESSDWGLPSFEDEA